MNGGDLLDLNVLIALLEPAHTHHLLALDWFDHSRKGSWGLCPLTESGFIRVTTRPGYSAGPRSMELAIAVLQTAKGHPDCRFWEITKGWVDVAAPLVKRIFGHQQITDAYLLGLAIAKGGALVTFDRGLRFLAESEFERNLLVLE